MKIYFAADHAGFELKNALIEYVRTLGHEAEDCGAFAFDKDDDYPHFIAAAAKKLSDDARSGVESRAIVLGASGQGEAIVANRFRGVRCALYYGAAGVQKDAGGTSLDMIASTREHNDSNALSLGARFIRESEAKEVVAAWLDRAFPGEERHVRRIKQIDSLT
ncbi:MAG: RpiB/LacA/LacB family sugar-phosphate isomerase [Candidatus Kaiserbacteria bacterium]|nr:MAG: RpiB/LacA/LacB family sugar-phosphate isomerase [Candidatus Kaiserbacteria bacterium]